MDQDSQAGTVTNRLQGEARVFGQPATVATVVVAPRADSHRTLRTALALLGTAVLTPAAFLVPPHAPWGVGALVGGLLLTRRQWAHTHSVLEVAADCPNCGSPLCVTPGSRLKFPHPLSCDHCQRAVTIHVDD